MNRVHAVDGAGARQARATGREKLPRVTALALALCAWGWWAHARLPITRGDEPLPSTPKTVELHLAEQWAIEHPTHHVQGLEVSDQWFWITAVDRAQRAGWVMRVDRASRRVEVERRIDRGGQIHPGGCQSDGRRLWVPVAEYRPRSTTTMLALDPLTLEEIAALPCDDHLGGLASDGDETLWGVNWDSRQFYVYRTNGQMVASHDNPTGVAYQDLKWRAGWLVCGGQWRSPKGPLAVVDVIDPQTWQCVARYHPGGKVASGGQNFCREGCAWFDGDLYLLPEDGPRTRVYRFPFPELPQAPAPRGSASPPAPSGAR